MKALLTAFIGIFALLSIKAQPGCTDPLATNYDPVATTNDGSCVYSPTSYMLQEVELLPDQLEETSGLAYFANGLWSHNDTDNPNEIYRIDTLTGEILQTVVLDTFANIDWEEMAESASHLYIGDFGNNLGNRRNLRILRIAKDELSEDTVKAEEIRFQYSDQTDFSTRPNNHDFDCEAFIFYNDSLHLFTKNWVDNQTRHYTLANEPGDQVVRLKGTFDAGGLITAADINEDGVLVLLGYQNVNNFLWLLFDYPNEQFFEGNKRRIELGLVVANGQTEGLVFNTPQGGYLSAESLTALGITIPQKLFRFRVDQWTSPEVLNIDPIQVLPEPRVSPNPFVDYLQIEWPLVNSPVYLQLMNASGQEVLQYRLNHSGSINLNHSLAQLPSGVYYLMIHQGNHQWSYRLIKKAE